MPEQLCTKKEYQSLLLKFFGSSPKLRIIDFFMDNPLSDFTEKEVIDALGMSKQIFYKNFYKLQELGIVKAARRGRTVLYTINMKHLLVKGFYKVVTQMSLKIAEKEAEKMKKTVAVKSR